MHARVNFSSQIFGENKHSRHIYPIQETTAFKEEVALPMVTEGREGHLASRAERISQTLRENEQVSLGVIRVIDRLGQTYS